MADYGHELVFGTFITPQNQHPDDVVALAQLTERAGLDLVTFQPLSARVSGHVDAALLRRGQDRGEWGFARRCRSSSGLRSSPMQVGLIKR